MTDVFGGAPIQTEVHIFNEDVRGHHDRRAVHRHNGGIVAWRHRDVPALRQPPHDGVHQRPLAPIGEGLALGLLPVPPVPIVGVVTGHSGGLAVVARHPVPSWPAEGRLQMVTAYILIQTEVGRAAEVADQISKISGVALAPISLLHHSHPPAFRVELILAAGCDNNERAR